MTVLILGLILFLGAHSVQIVMPELRARVIARAGQGAWMGSYAAISGIGLVLIIVGYGLARGAAPIVYSPPPAARHLTFLLMLPVFPLLIATYARGRIGQALGHPMLIAVLLWAAAHLLANGSVADLFLFGGFLVWAALDWRSVLARQAPVATATRVPWARNDAIAIIGGLVVYVALIGGLHRLLFGVSPL